MAHEPVPLSFGIIAPLPRRNRVDPFGDLQARPERGMFTGNRGCLVDEANAMVRHHQGRLWIICVLSYKGWKSPLDQPRHWTPLFFLDEAVALAAGHRPCGLCRRPAYDSYRKGVARALGIEESPTADQLNRMLAAERLAPGRGMERAGDRLTWHADLASLPDGTVILAEGRPLLVRPNALYEFGFGGWTYTGPHEDGKVAVLTPPTSVRALQNGFSAVLHQSASTR